MGETCVLLGFFDHPNLDGDTILDALHSKGFSETPNRKQAVCELYMVA